MAKKYVEKYQIVNPSGEPVGPPQVFEADTKDELIALLKAAHQNAASKFYETKKAVKLGLLMEPDSERPVQEFVERPLTADERTRLTSELNNASTQDAAFTKLLEAKFGAPLSVVRENLQEVEQNKYIKFVQEQVDLFKLDFPDYVESVSNRESLKGYLLKKGWPVTRKNLGIAYTDLLEEGDILVVRQPVDETETVVVPAAAASTEDQPAPHSESEITIPATGAAPISAVTPVVRPAVSSTLGRGSSSVPAAPAIKTKGITIQEVNAMTATEYARRLTDPEFVKEIEALYAKK